MKRIVVGLIIGVVSLMAAESKVDGEKVFEKACASCHIKMISKPELMKVMKTVKAPPMIEVSSQLKNNIKIVEDIDDEIHRAVVIAFIKDYVLYPDLDKSMCTGAALDRFGLMPSQKGIVTKKELTKISEWI
jgi:hypothetical protein